MIFKPGDRVEVDLSDMYLAMCGACEERTLMLPNGSCANCHAPESEATWLCDLGAEDFVPNP